MRTVLMGRPAGLIALGLLALALASIAVAWPRPALAQGPAVDIPGELASIRLLMRQSMDAYEAGDRDEAFKLARAAYLDHFELVEIPFRIIDSNFTLEMEYRFAQWRARIQDGEPVEEVEALVREIETGLDEVEAVFEGPGLLAPGLAVAASFSILFREGLEAILILAALLAYLRTHNPALRRPIWIGAGLAIPASILTWFLITAVVRIAPVGRELLEAIVSLVAVVTLFYVSFWLLQRLEVRHWMEFLRARVWAAVSGGNALALGVLAFVAVYREGAETALFYQVLLWLAVRLEQWVLLGAVLAVVALTVLGWIILFLGTRVPVRAFLGVAVVLVMTISVGMLGNAVNEFQEAGILGVTLLDWFPRLNPFAAGLLGLHPTAETLATQGALLAVYLLGAAYVFWWQPRRAGLARD